MFYITEILRERFCCFLYVLFAFCLYTIEPPDQSPQRKEKEISIKKKNLRIDPSPPNETMIFAKQLTSWLPYSVITATMSHTYEGGKVSVDEMT